MRSKFLPPSQIQPLYKCSLYLPSRVAESNGSSASILLQVKYEREKSAQRPSQMPRGALMGIVRGAKSCSQPKISLGPCGSSASRYSSGRGASMRPLTHRDTQASAYVLLNGPYMLEAYGRILIQAKTSKCYRRFKEASFTAYRYRVEDGRILGRKESTREAGDSTSADGALLH